MTVLLLNEGDQFTETFTATVTDDFGATDTQTVSIVINGTNDSPIISVVEGGDAGAVTEAGNLDDGTVVPGTLTASGDLNSSDVDAGDGATWSIATDANATDYGMNEGDQFTETFTATVTDDFGATDTQTVSIVINGTNDSPTLTVNVVDGEVDEAGLPTGTSPAPVGDILANGTLTFDDVDADATLKVFVDGNEVGTLDGTTNVIGTTDLGDHYGVIAFKGDGSWEYTLNENIDNDDLTTNPLATDLQGPDSFQVQVIDEFDAYSAEQTLTINVLDDVPIEYNPTDALLLNDGLDTATESLNTLSAIGADNYGTSTNVSFDIDKYDDFDSSMTSNDEAILLNASVDGKALTGSTLNGGTIFTVGIVDASDNYTVTMSGIIDNNSGISFGNLSGTGEAGNQSFQIVESTTEDNLEIMFTPLGSATTVNNDSDDVAVDSQGGIADGDGLRVDFGMFSNNPESSPSGNDDTFIINDKTTINGFRFTIDSIATGTTATMTLAAYDVEALPPDQSLINDDPDPIIKVEIYDGTTLLAVWDDAGNGAIAGIDFTDNGHTVTVSNLLAGYSIVTYTADGYDSIEIMNEEDISGTDGKFSLSNLEVLVTDTGDPIHQSFDTILTDADGDTSDGTIDVTFAPSDAILGTSGDDNPLTGTPDSDMIYGGDGDDTIVFDAADSYVDGGEGYDTLEVTGTDNPTQLDFSNVYNIEQIDMDNGIVDQEITLTMDDVLNMTGPDGGTLEITGDGTGDQVTITYDGNEWDTPTVDAGIYTFMSTDVTPIQVDIDPDNVTIVDIEI